jgi:hypothetical protein
MSAGEKHSGAAVGTYGGSHRKNCMMEFTPEFLQGSKRSL